MSSSGSTHSSGHGPSDGGSTFYTSRSPLMEHFKKIKDPTPATVFLMRRLEYATDFLYKTPELDGLHAGEHDCVQLIDISHSSGLKATHAMKLDDQIEDTVKMTRQVNDLLVYLQQVDDSTHTRIIILQKMSGSRLPGCGYYDEFLYLHIMIVEMGIPPTLAVRMLRPWEPNGRWMDPAAHDLALSDFDTVVRPAERPNMAQFFGFEPDIPTMLGGWHLSAIDLGRRLIGGHSVYTVLVCSDNPQFELNLRRKLHDWHQERALDLNVKPLKRLRSLAIGEALAAYCQDPRIQLEASKPTPSWANALIQVLACHYSIKPWSMSEDPLRLEDTVLEQRCQIAQEFYRAAKQDLLKCELFLANHSDFTMQDCAAVLRFFHFVVEDLGGEYEKIAASFERRSTLRSIEMARLSINESRSTIRLTWLATTFIPVSLASSIFGMNVREIDAEKTGIWRFAATAAVLLAISAYSWCLSRAIRNYKICIQRSGRPWLKWYTSPSVVHKVLSEHCPDYRGSTLPYILGFRRVEDLGLLDYNET